MSIYCTLNSLYEFRANYEQIIRYIRVDNTLITRCACSEFRVQRIKCFHKFLQINLFHTVEDICHIWSKSLLFFTFSRCSFLINTVLAKPTSFPPFLFCSYFFIFPSIHLNRWKLNSLYESKFYSVSSNSKLNWNLIRCADNSLHESGLR